MIPNSAHCTYNTLLIIFNDSYLYILDELIITINMHSGELPDMVELELNLERMSRPGVVSPADPTLTPVVIVIAHLEVIRADRSCRLWAAPDHAEADRPNIHRKLRRRTPNCRVCPLVASSMTRYHRSKGNRTAPRACKLCDDGNCTAGSGPCLPTSAVPARASILGRYSCFLWSITCDRKLII